MNKHMLFKSKIHKYKYKKLSHIFSLGSGCLKRTIVECVANVLHGHKEGTLLQALYSLLYRQSRRYKPHLSCCLSSSFVHLVQVAGSQKTDGKQINSFCLQEIILLPKVYQEKDFGLLQLLSER